MIAGLEENVGVGLQSAAGTMTVDIPSAPASTARSAGWVEGSAVTSVMTTSPAPPYVEGEEWSTPQDNSMPILWRRALRTTLPFVASDVVALSICGLVAQIV